MVSGDLGGLGQGQQLVALVSKGLLDLACRPLERAGLGLTAEGLSEFLGLGEDLSDCLVYGAALLPQTDTPPKESCSSGGVFARGGLCAGRVRKVKASDLARLTLRASSEGQSSPAVAFPNTGPWEALSPRFFK